jgi:hypothetical protein
MWGSRTHGHRIIFYQSILIENCSSSQGCLAPFHHAGLRLCRVRRTGRTSSAGKMSHPVTMTRGHRRRRTRTRTHDIGRPNFISGSPYSGDRSKNLRNNLMQSKGDGTVSS